MKDSRRKVVSSESGLNVALCVFHAVDGAPPGRIEMGVAVTTAPCRERRDSTRLKASIETYGYLKARRRAVDGGRRKVGSYESGLSPNSMSYFDKKGIFQKLSCAYYFRMSLSTFIMNISDELLVFFRY